jgi:hypothetical protein
MIMEDQFKIKNELEFFQLSFNEVFDFPEKTCSWGGYDLKAKINLKSGSFSAIINGVYTSTGNIYDFYKQLIVAQKILSGSAKYRGYEGDFELTIHYTETGGVIVQGYLVELHGPENQLDFTFYADQTFIPDTLRDLEVIVQKYGDNYGIKGYHERM